MKIKLHNQEIVSSFFIILPTLYSISAFFVFTYPLHPSIQTFLPIPLYSGLVILIFGAFLPIDKRAAQLRMIGWFIFSFYWSTQPLTLYYSEQEDIVNAIICIIGIYVLFYFSYREWYSIKTQDFEKSLKWIAGASAIAGLIYFIIEKTALAPQLINIIALQSGLLLNLFTGNVVINPPYLSYFSAHIRIIFACTAVQSMVIFIGMILPLPKVSKKRKIKGLIVTIIPIYFLNLIRNAGITFLVGIYGDSFFSIAHNYIGKGGSLLALIIILIILSKIIPEIFDQILAITDLPKHPGPLEKMVKKHIWRRK